MRRQARYFVNNVIARTWRSALQLLVLPALLSLSAAPEIESIAPRTLRPGVVTEIKFSGSGLTEATNVWASFPAKVESLGEGRFRITPPANWPVGISTVRLYGTNGVSPLSFVMCDDLPTHTESKTNTTRAAAQRLDWGSAVEGRCDELAYDWYQVRVSKGQRLAIEVVASRLGSRLDSVLRLFDANGKQLAQNDDAPGLRGDSFLSFSAPSDGDYFIELRDVNYAGNSEMFYRLRVGDFALATTAFPAFTAPGRQSFVLAGPGGEVGRAEVPAGQISFIPLARRGARGSAFAQAWPTTRREMIEREPNDSAARATKISATDGVNGRFDKAGDRDWYEFTARAGERLEFRAATRSLGAPCDVVLELLSADGKSLARSNPTAADEGVVTHKFATNNTYRLMVEEATGAFGPNCVYHITADRAAGFALTLDSDRFNVAPGKTFDLKVSIARGDFKGAVTLALEEIESLLWTNNVIAEGKSNATMKVTVPENFTPGPPRFLRVIGTAQRDGTEVRTRASTAPAWRRKFPQMLYTPVEFDGDVALGVIAR